MPPEDAGLPGDTGLPEDRGAPSVTVAVVVKDRVGAMARCLDAIDALEGPADLEVVVVDNGSTDGTWDLLRSRAPQMRWPTRVRQQAGSVGAARNAALQAARAPLIAYTDSDCQPDPGWLLALLAALTDDVAVVQGTTLPADGPRHRWSATQHIDRWSGLYEACNIAYRVADLRDAGGFDADIGFFGEDTVAGWNLRRAGGRGTFAADAVVRHDVTHPGPGWFLRRGWGYANWPALVRRHPEMRRDLLWAGVFLRRRRIAAWGALVGLGLGGAQVVRGGRPWALLLLAPEVAVHRPRRRGLRGVGDLLAGMLFDGAVSAGLLRGMVRERTPVL